MCSVAYSAILRCYSSDCEVVCGEFVMRKRRFHGVWRRVLCRLRWFGCEMWLFHGAEMAVGDINPSFSDWICGVFRYKQPVLRTLIQGFTNLIHNILNAITPIPDTNPNFQTTFRHFQTQFTHFQTLISPLQHTITLFSRCDYLRFRY